MEQDKEPKKENKSYRFWIVFITFTLVLSAVAYATTISDANPSDFPNGIKGISTYMVDDVTELESVISNLQAGDVVYIAEGTYRTTDWLKIDVSNITIIGSGMKNTIIKPSDNSNVGGFMIGNSTPVKNIVIKRLGYDGNWQNQDNSTKRLHGIHVVNGTYINIEENYLTKTHPYHEHDSGGSGITVDYGSSDVIIKNNLIEDIGDRGIQVAGKNILITSNRINDGYDRSISLDVIPRTNIRYFSQHVIVSDNIMSNNVDGSLVGIGVSAPNNTDYGGYEIVDNYGYGEFKSFFVAHNDADDINVANNFIKKYSNTSLLNPSIRILSNSSSNIVINGNFIYNSPFSGISMNGINFMIINNYIYNVTRQSIAITSSASNGHVFGNYMLGNNKTYFEFDNNGTNIILENNFPSKSNSDMEKDLVGFWSFDGYGYGNPSRAYDSSKINNSGTVNTATFVDGHRSAALLFDGTGGNVTILDNSNYSIQASGNEGTICMWINITGSTGDQQRLFHKSSEYSLKVNDDQTIQIDLFGSNQKTSQKIRYLEWNHVCWSTQPGIGGNLYINGQKQSYLDSDTSSDTTNNVILGHDNTFQEFLNGTIDEVKIWNRQLNDNEIISDFNLRGNQGNGHFILRSD